MKFKNILLVLTMSSLAASCVATLETTNVSIAPGFKKVFSQDLGGPGTLTELIPVSETPDAWTKMFTIQYLKIQNKTPQEAMKRFTSRAKDRCGNKFQYKVLTEDKNSVTYEQTVKNCKQVDFLKFISRGVQIDDCNVNYFTGLLWKGSEIMKTPSKCDKTVTQTEIVRILKGNEGLHRVAFTHKASKITGTDRRNWLASLERAYVVKGGSKVVVK